VFNIVCNDLIKRGLFYDQMILLNILYHNIPNKKNR
jgi:hypothetical protein